MKETLSIVGGKEVRTGSVEKTQSQDSIVSLTPVGARGRSAASTPCGAGVSSWTSGAGGATHHIQGQTCGLRTVIPTFPRKLRDMLP